MNSLIRRICGSLEARLSQPRISLWRTVWFNFRTLPFSQARKLPVFIYSKVKLFQLQGEVEITAPIKRGMIKIGNNTGSFTCCDGSGFIQITDGAKVVFNGPCEIGANSKVRVVAGALSLGSQAYISSNVRIVCNGSSITIGEGTRIAFETLIMNSGFHFVEDLATGMVSYPSRPIVIGAYNWIGNRSTVNAGAHTKPYTIICSGSLVGKDFTVADGENQMLGGSPAKVIKTGIRRIFDPELDARLFSWFHQHPGIQKCNIKELEHS